MGVRFAVGEWNSTWTLQYDASGRLQRVYYLLVSTDTGVQSYFVEFGYTGQNNISSFTDRGGNLVGVTDPSVNRFDLTYDSANCLTQILEPLVTDAWGNTETARHRTDYLYDTSGNLIEVRQYTDATNYLSTRYGYDSYGQLTTITDARGKVTRYGYDGSGNMVSLTTRLGCQTQWRYENASSTSGVW